MTRQSWLKALLSVFIIYHVFCIFILPNAGGFIGRYLQRAITPYGNFLSLNTPWNLFSPDPANSLYFKFSIHYAENHDPEVEEAFFPPERAQIVKDSSHRRLLYAMRYLALDPQRIDLIVGPWICREHPGALSVNIRIIEEKVPGLDAVLLNPDLAQPDTREKSESTPEVYNCQSQEGVT